MKEDLFSIQTFLVSSLRNNWLGINYSNFPNFSFILINSQLQWSFLYNLEIDDRARFEFENICITSQSLSYSQSHNPHEWYPFNQVLVGLYK